MTNPLPPIISRYFTAADDGDIDALVGCFTPDAVVRLAKEQIAAAK